MRCTSVIQNQVYLLVRHLLLPAGHAKYTPGWT